MNSPSLRFTTALASALADLGVEHAAISPGSRNAALIAGFAGQERIRLWPVLDERSAGFFGVGLARATRKPVAIICTSGTAAAEYHPAVVEAELSNVPLIVLTADRPRELRGIGAPQTIDQVALYGASPVLFIDVPPPDETTDRREALELAREAVLGATAPPVGPVHLNLQFREPLLGPKVDGVDTAEPPLQAATLPEPKVTPVEVAEVTRQVSGRRGLIVVGRSNDPDLPAAVTTLAASTGFPVHADPLSGCRHGGHSLDLILGHGDALASAGTLDQLVPEVVIRLGHVPTSKAIWSWLEDHPEVAQVLAGSAGQDATRSAGFVSAAPAARFAAGLASQISTAAPGDWSAAWMDADRAAGSVLRQIVAQAPFPNEPAIARTVLEQSPPGTVITVGSSMPIRDVDTYGGKSDASLQILGNRGGNGIDGLVSTMLGTAAAGHPAVALVGDVSMFHDLNAIGTASQLGLPATIVVVNNDGGGIFHFLPQAQPDLMDAETFETFMGTPHGTDFVAVADSLGIEAHGVEDAGEFSHLLATRPGRPRIIELRTNRHDNAALHRRIAAAVRSALD